MVNGKDPKTGDRTSAIVTSHQKHTLGVALVDYDKSDSIHSLPADHFIKGFNGHVRLDQEYRVVRQNDDGTPKTFLTSKTLGVVSKEKLRLLQANMGPKPVEAANPTPVTSSEHAEDANPAPKTLAKTPGNPGNPGNPPLENPAILPSSNAKGAARAEPPPNGVSWWK
jgi:hypothetical protein